MMKYHCHFIWRVFFLMVVMKVISGSALAELPSYTVRKEAVHEISHEHMVPWWHFRGTDSTCSTPDENIPDELGEKNIQWKTLMPGRSSSGPVVMGDLVITLGMSGTRCDQLLITAVNAQTGKISWNRTIWATGRAVFNPFATLANCTPAADAQHLVAFFSSNDVVCLDRAGNILWMRGLGNENPLMGNDNGMASSPLIVDNVVILQMQNPGTSLLMGLDIHTGKTLWAQPREQAAFWASPVKMRLTDGRNLCVCTDRKTMQGLDVKTGKVIFTYDAPCHSVASCVVSGECLFLPAEGMLSLRPVIQTKNGNSSVSLQKIWYERKLWCDNPSAAVADGKIYVMKGGGIFICADARTGKILWQKRQTGPFWATPLLTRTHAYLINYSGLLQVVDLRKKGTLCSKLQLDTGVLGTPAAWNGAIYIRSDKYLYKIAK